MQNSRFIPNFLPKSTQINNEFPLIIKSDEVPFLIHRDEKTVIQDWQEKLPLEIRKCLAQTLLEAIKKIDPKARNDKENSKNENLQQIQEKIYNIEMRADEIMNAFDDHVEGRRMVERISNYIAHTSQCPLQKCVFPWCNSIKPVLQHANACPRNVSGGCEMCQRISSFCVHHFQNCKDNLCTVAFCNDLKRKMMRKIYEFKKRL